MAEIRFNYGDKFTQTTDTNTGIGSTIPAAKLDIAGGTSAGSLRVSGIATLSSYQGFVNTKLSTTEDLIVEAGQSGSVSGEVVIGTGQTISVSTGATTGQGGIQSLKVYKTFMPPVGGTADRPTDVKPGMVYYNMDYKTIEFWDGNFWKQVDNTTRRGRGVFAGGRSPGDSAIIDYINIASTGNAKTFGNLQDERTDCSGMSNEIRGIWAGGKNPSVSTLIDYVTLASEGDGVDFGDVTPAACGGSGAAASSSTRGVFALGQAPSNSNILSFLQIMTTGNSIDFGDLTGVLYEGAGCGSETRGIINKGQGSLGNDFITIASKGDALDFGEDTGRTDSQRGCGSCSNSTRGLFAGGGPSGPVSINVMRYITIASTGNAIDFGDRTIQTRLVSAAANGTRGVFTSGLDPSINYNVMDFVTISTLGDAQDFGDLTDVFHAHTGVSDSHGGLGGF